MHEEALFDQPQEPTPREKRIGLKVAVSGLALAVATAVGISLVSQKPKEKFHPQAYFGEVLRDEKHRATANESYNGFAFFVSPEDRPDCAKSMIIEPGQSPTGFVLSEGDYSNSEPIPIEGFGKPSVDDLAALALKSCSSS